MGAGIATIGRRSYAVGLYWENSPSGRLAQAAKEAARQPGQQVDFYALRAGNKDGRVPQFGLGQKIAGHKASMPVFAACLANQQPGSWAGAFRVREGTVITVVRDDLIVPDGDQVFLNETEARDRLLQEISFGGLQRIYAPEAWSISGADSMPVSLLLNDQSDVKLRAIEIPKQVILVGGLAVLLLLLVIGIGFYLQAQPEPEVVTNTGPVVPLAPPKPVYPPPDRRWEHAPTPMTVIEGCRAALAKIPAAVNGWRLMPFKCDGHGISLSWSRDKVVSGYPKGATVNDSASSATSSISLPDLPTRQPEDLWDQPEITNRFMSQDWPGSITRAPDDPPPAPPPGYQGEWNPPPAPWVKRSFTITVPVLPSNLGLYIGDVPGVVINMLSYSAGSNGGTWQVEGVIYENRNPTHTHN